MIKFIIELFLSIFFRTVLWFRYRIKIKGLDKLTPEILNKPGGILFLPNHPTVFVDATAVTVALWPKFRLRPLIVEYMYFLPIVNQIIKLLDGLPVPNFSTSSNSIKQKKNEAIIQEVIKGLKQKQNFLIFPAGRTKSTAHEAVDGASAVHRIVQNTPEVNVVLVRVKGLWGSSFSRALTGAAPPLFPTLFHGLKYILKNLIFFSPRREVVIEFVPAPKDFPTKAAKIEFNKYLEHWYDQPDGLRPQTTAYPGDSLIFVSYSMWKEEIPKLWQAEQTAEDQIALTQIPIDVQHKVIAKIVELTNADPKTVKPDMSLSADLGMDSLDLAEMTAFLQDQFDIVGVTGQDLTTVIRVMGFAAQKIVSESKVEEEESDISAWKRPVDRKKVHVAEGQTIPEVFLNNCQQMGSAIACGDMRTGVMAFPQLKLRTIILAEYIRSLPGKYVGIMLPASVTATMCILACQLAGKIPLMVNWTVGPRHLQSVVQLTNVQVVLSSWAFLDRLQNVDFNGIDERLVMLEDVRLKIGFKEKIKGYFRAKRNPQAILKAFGADKISPDNDAVLLFTSGTESMPKGVPLSHSNLLNNLRNTIQEITLYTDDVLLGILPPFHSFGFTISSLFTPLAGGRTAFSPDPTDGKRLANAFERWRATIALGPPTFIKGMIKAANPSQLKTMRLCVTGAEKMPHDLEVMVKQLGKEDGLMEGYGITECAPVLTFTQTGKNRHGVGRPVPGVELCIVNLETHQPVPKGTQGLILARGPNVFSGYLNPGLTPPFTSVNNQKWYVTGDLGYFDEQENLFISSRLKRFVKTGGEMISLAALEEALIQTAVQKDWAKINDGPILAVCATEHPGEKPKFYVFSRFSLNVDDANRALKDAGFSNLARIHSVISVEEIPVMGTGKTNYRKLEETHLAKSTG